MLRTRSEWDAFIYFSFFWLVDWYASVLCDNNVWVRVWPNHVGFYLCLYGSVWKRMFEVVKFFYSFYTRSIILVRTVNTIIRTLMYDSKRKLKNCTWTVCFSRKRVRLMRLAFGLPTHAHTVPSSWMTLIQCPKKERTRRKIRRVTVKWRFKAEESAIEKELNKIRYTFQYVWITSLETGNLLMRFGTQYIVALLTI